MSEAARLDGTPAQARAQDQRASRWLAGGGLRPTRQRVALARLLVGDGKNRHITAESLFEAARAAGVQVSLATVYNTLRSFTDAGLLTEIPLEGTRTHFDTNVSDHPHFFWEEEGRLTDAPHDELRFERLPSPPEGAEITKVDVVIRLRRR
ncbi:MAG TPA: Fur family transcriptional regulator [Thermohalobaculum sp.]|nr:Fur family transcriptional regulator [Thermohalobaculum sp.]